jgi:hypothetical protein
MPVRCPTCQWPTALDERGPREDPSILLTGTVRIANAAIQIVAIRVSPAYQRRPDYKEDVPRPCYQTNGLDAVLETFLEDFEYVGEEFGELLGDGGSDMIELASGCYVLAALPASYFPTPDGSTHDVE